jgi:hypothetical protein
MRRDERRCIIDAVPDHHDPFVARERLECGNLVFGQQPGPVIEADLRRDGGTGAGVVAGQHDAVDAHRQLRRNRRRSIRPRFVPQGKKPQKPVGRKHRDHGLALRLQRLDPRQLRVGHDAGFGRKARGADGPAYAVERCDGTFFGDGTRVVGLGQLQPLRSGLCQNRPAQWVACPVFDGGGNAQQIRFAAEKHDDFRHLRVALGQGSGLVEGHEVDARRSLKQGAALNQQPMPRPGRKRRGDGGRNGDHQRAGAPDEHLQAGPVLRFKSAGPMPAVFRTISPGTRSVTAVCDRWSA